MEVAEIEDQELGVIEAEAEEVDELVDNDQAEVADETIDADGADEAEDAEDSVEITLGDESLTSTEEDKDAPDWVRELRKEYKETKRQNRELQKRLEEREVATQKVDLTLPPEPELEDFDFDTDRYRMAVREWHKKEAKVNEHKKAQELQVQSYHEEIQKKLVNYETLKADLGVKDFKDAEDVAVEHFNIEQQRLILEATDNPALTVYAIGKNASRAKELSQIKDPIKFAAAVVRLESQLKVNKRKAKPTPEQQVKGSSGRVGGVDSTLQRLEAEALKTNDYTKVFAYEKRLRDKQKSKQ